MKIAEELSSPITWQRKIMIFNILLDPLYQGGIDHAEYYIDHRDLMMGTVGFNSRLGFTSSPIVRSRG